MTAINIISVGVNCPELTSPKASWQTEGTVEIHSFHSLGRGYRFFTVQGSSKEASPHYQSSWLLLRKLGTYLTKQKMVWLVFTLKTYNSNEATDIYTKQIKIKL